MKCEESSGQPVCGKDGRAVTSGALTKYGGIEESTGRSQNSIMYLRGFASTNLSDLYVKGVGVSNYHTNCPTDDPRFWKSRK